MGDAVNFERGGRHDWANLIHYELGRLACLWEMKTGLRPGRTVSAKLRTSFTWSDILIFTLAPFESGCTDAEAGTR